MGSNNGKNSGVGGLVIVIIAMALLLSMCSSSGSSKSGRKWSDLSEVEKANARWAYEVQQSLK